MVGEDTGKSVKEKVKADDVSSMILDVIESPYVF